MANGTRFLKNISRRDLRGLAWLGVSLVFIGLFALVTWAIHDHGRITGIEGWDSEILIWIADRRSSRLNGIAVEWTALGSVTLLTLFTVLGVILSALHRDRLAIGYLIFASAGAGILSTILKGWISRDRPTVVARLVEESGFSYPSGHSFASSAFYLILMFIGWRRFSSWRARAVLSACAVFVILGVGVTRLYLGVHYPSDVVSGTCLGAGWACLLTTFYSRWAAPKLGETIVKTPSRLP